MQVHSQTDVGLVRPQNEDACETGLLNGGAFAVVCDGMGGANGGDVASQLAVESISRQILEAAQLNFSGQTMEQLLYEIILRANAEIYAAAQRNPELKGMGTTVVAVVALNHAAYIAHAGDSRAYLYRNGELTQITTDHSMVQELIENGDLTEEQAKVYPQKNIITRALGVHSTVEIDYRELPLLENDRILICTDGLTNYAEAEQIKALAQYADSAFLAKNLIGLAKQNGGGDNITVAILDN